MTHPRSLIIIAAVIAVLGSGERAHAQDTMKHSGPIVSIDDKAGTIVTVVEVATP